MDPHIFIARAEGQRWLSIAEKLLISQDLVGSKTFAIRARESDPRLEAADQILAIIDTLLAAEKRLISNNGTHQPDYYAILQLVRFVQNTTDHISAQYRQLAFLLNPNQNRFPYSEQAFHLVNDAYSVLSDPIRKSIYDSDIHYIDISQQPPPPPHQYNLIDNNNNNHHHHHHHNNNNNHNNNSNNNNNIGFNLEIQQDQHHHHHQQHNFFDPPQQMFEQQQQQQPQHNFLFQQNSVRGIPGVPVRDHEELFQPHVHPFHITSTRPLQQATQPSVDQPPMSWPQQMQQQQQQQANRAGENAGNGVEGGDVEIERESNDGNVDGSATFWTTCPYCLNMYEHYKVYVDCILRCENCKRAFQAVPIPAPPDVAEDQETYFCCWGFYPIGVSMMQLGKKVGENGRGGKSDWTPFSTLNDVSSQVKNDVSSQVKDRLNDNVGMKTKLWEPWVYIDDVTDDIFDGISEESSDDSDDDWGSTKKKKSKKVKRDVGHKRKQRFTVGRNGKNVENSIPVPEGEEEPRGHAAESSKKAVAGNPRRQSGRVAKELGKLDLNVEFNNNEGEEPFLRMAAGNRGNGQGDEVNVEEGIGFFEGLDEFLSNLPILSVNDEENVKDS